MGNTSTQIKRGGAYYITFPGYEAKEDSSGLSIPTGHAGVLLVDNNGTTKYFEYGRYSNEDPKKYGESSNRGIVRKLTVPNFNGANSDKIWNIIKDAETQNIGGKITVSEIPDFDFSKGMDYINTYSNDSNRKNYNLLMRNCGSFADNVIKAGYTGQGKLPTVILRTPVNYSEEYEKAGFNTNTFKRGGILKRVESGKSGIHIKPENRGKFTALKKRTGKSSTWYKEHGTPEQKKMAVFALNAKKWKH